MTIKDIARESGYAVGTVSRVLNNSPNVSETARKAILEVAEKYHFRLNSNAKHLKQQASKGISIIVKGSQNMFFASIVEQMQDLIEEKGYTSVIYYIGEDDDEVEQAQQICRERRPLGILFLGSGLKNFREGFDGVQVPCVLVTNSAETLGYENLSSVSTDDEAGAIAAIEHLLSLGHTKIGVLGGTRGKSYAASTRCKGCEKAFAAHRMPFMPYEQYEEARFAIADGYQAMERLLDKMPDVTAVFAMSDVIAIGAMRAIRDRGLWVPEDISVIGFDGIDLGNYLTPKLTTICQDRERITHRSVEILLDRIENGTPAVYETVPFHIISGESTRKI